MRELRSSRNANFCGRLSYKFRNATFPAAI